VSPIQGLEVALWLLVGLPAGVLIFVLALKRVLLWLDERGYIFYTGNPTTYGSLGNAFLDLQSMVDPSAAYVLEAKDLEEQGVEEDGEAGASPHEVGEGEGGVEIDGDVLDRLE
jgi:hypothetical protein